MYIPEDAVCTNCDKRKATIWWVGEMGFMALSHGGGKPWCELCAIREQLKYAEKQQIKIRELKGRILELEANE